MKKIGLQIQGAHKYCRELVEMTGIQVESFKINVRKLKFINFKKKRQVTEWEKGSDYPSDFSYAIWKTSDREIWYVQNVEEKHYHNLKICTQPDVNSSVSNGHLQLQKLWNILPIFLISKNYQRDYSSQTTSKSIKSLQKRE